MYLQTSENRAPTSVVVMMMIFACVFQCLTGETSGQDDKIPKGVVPPPLSILSKGEKKSLDSAVKLSDRTKAALALMNGRLFKATELSKKDEFQKSLNQLGHFQAILRNHMKYLKRRENDRRALKYFKRFEMALRGFLPRLELIRRETPFKYGYHVRSLVKNVRKARRDAINPFFDDTVVPEGKS